MDKLLFFTFKLAASAQVPAGDLGLPKVAADDATLHIIFNIIFVFMGGWATLYLIVGAFRFITSNGNQASIKQARETILYAAIGLAISVLAFTIVQFVLGKVG